MTTLRYDITAISMPLWFNTYGDHDHNGKIFILSKYKDILAYVKRVQANKDHTAEQQQDLAEQRESLARTHGLEHDPLRKEEWLPATAAAAKRPHPLIVPLVLRGALGDTLEIHLENELEPDEEHGPRHVGLHLIGPGGESAVNDGSHVGANPSSLVPPGEQRLYTWHALHEGVFVFHDAGDFRGTEAGTNAHGLFGALVVEPAGSRWSDPETGDDLIHPFSKEILGTGLYVDVHQRHSADLEWGAKAPFPDPFNPDSLTQEYPDAWVTTPTSPPFGAWCRCRIGNLLRNPRRCDLDSRFGWLEKSTKSPTRHPGTSPAQVWQEDGLSMVGR